MKEFVWNKPVLAIFKERDVKPESEPFVVVKAKKLTVTRSDGELNGNIKDFFKIMGNLDYLSSTQGINDHYIICWFDDTEQDMTKDFRRLSKLTFNDKVDCVISKNGKRTYNGSFKAEHGKLE